jgi:hypothetical protein
MHAGQDDVSTFVHPCSRRVLVVHVLLSLSPLLLLFTLQILDFRPVERSTSTDAISKRSFFKQLVQSCEGPRSTAHHPVVRSIHYKIGNPGVVEISLLPFSHLIAMTSLAKTR